MPRNVVPTNGISPGNVVEDLHRFQTDQRCVSERVAAIEQRLQTLLAGQAALIENAKEGIVAALENAIRIGWCLIDIRHEIRGSGSLFDGFIARSSLSKSQIYRLIAAASKFQRDQTELDFSIANGLTSSESISPIPLTQQLQQTKATNFSQLLAAGGLITPSGRTQAPNVAIVPIAKLARKIDAAYMQHTRVTRSFPIHQWSTADIQVLLRKLEPLVSLHAQLLERVHRANG